MCRRRTMLRTIIICAQVDFLAGKLDVENKAIAQLLKQKAKDAADTSKTADKKAAKPKKKV